jgi:serine/threonine-protein kinase RsbW
MTALHETFPVAATTIRAGRHRASHFALEHGASNRLAADVGLAVSEALTNAVLHSGASDGNGKVELHLACDGPELMIAVRDHGQGLRPRADSPGLGLGLPIIASLTQRLEIRRPQDGGTELRMVFALTG